MHNHSHSISRFMWISIAAAIITITLKTLAYFLTGSVGLLSDALESLVNLAAAVMALWMLRIAEKPPDKEHEYGHTKAEYFSSIVEGGLILIAAVSIGYTAVERIIHPQAIEQAFAGLAVSTVASLINLTVALVLLKLGKKHHSIALNADGHHLLTDVWTSVGVIAAVALVAVTHIQILDPLIALFVAANIIFTGYNIMKQSALGLMDTSLPEEELQQITGILNKYCKNGISYHGLRTRQSATRRFIRVHILVPGSWSVQKGHDLADEVEIEICKTFPKTSVITHLEPIEDPKSIKDIGIDRE